VATWSQQAVDDSVSRECYSLAADCTTTHNTTSMTVASACRCRATRELQQSSIDMPPCSSAEMSPLSVVSVHAPLPSLLNTHILFPFVLTVTYSQHHHHYILSIRHRKQSTFDQYFVRSESHYNETEMSL
jgi:hypothetical protein